jgi:hypothetical protein
MYWKSNYLWLWQIWWLIIIKILDNGELGIGYANLHNFCASCLTFAERVGHSIMKVQAKRGWLSTRCFFFYTGLEHTKFWSLGRIVFVMILSRSMCWQMFLPGESQFQQQRAHLIDYHSKLGSVSTAQDITRSFTKSWLFADIQTHGC